MLVGADVVQKTVPGISREGIDKLLIKGKAHRPILSFP